MFKQVLTKPQIRHVGLFLTQRMVGSPKHQTISKIRKMFLNAPSTNASDNFLNTPTMAWKMIKERRKEIISSKFKSKKGAIIVDDTKVYIPKEIADDFKSKYDLALEIIKDAFNRNLIKRVYFDSWYCQPELLRKLKPMSLEFFGMFRIGRLKIKTKGDSITLSQFVEKKIKENSFICRKLRGNCETSEYKNI